MPILIGKYIIYFLQRKVIPPSHGDGYIGNYPDINKYINREPIEKLKIKGYSLNEVLQKD